MRVERERGDRKTAREILKMDTGGREKNTRIPSQGGNAEGNDEK